MALIGGPRFLFFGGFFAFVNMLIQMRLRRQAYMCLAFILCRENVFRGWESISTPREDS